MTPSSRGRISVDLRGLKASLFEQAHARGVSPSGLVRDALIDALGRTEPPSLDHVAAGAPLPMEDRVRLSLRFNCKTYRIQPWLGISMNWIYCIALQRTSITKLP